MALKNPPDPDLGAILSLLRLVRHWYQRDVALVAGMPRTSITAYEKGKRQPRYETLGRILSALGFDLAAVDETRAFIGSLRRKYGLPSADDRKEVPELWGRLKLYPPSVQKSLVREAREFRHWALAEFIAHESARAGRDDPKRSLELAEVAVVIAEELLGPWGAWVQWYAVSHLGNARRIAEDLAGADLSFQRADELLRGSTRERVPLLEEARVLGMKAALRRSQRRLRESLALLKEALAGNPSTPLRAALLISQAKAVAELGDHEEAIAILKKAAPLVAGTGDQELLFIHRQNLVDCLSKDGRITEAAALLPEVKELLREVGGRLHELRVLWTEARIRAGQGERAEAVSFLSRIRSAFADLDLGYDCALASLELATLHAETGDILQVKALARHMVPIFKSKGVHREALAALAVFRKAAEDERISVELVRRVRDFLFRTRHNAEAIFEER